MEIHVYVLQYHPINVLDVYELALFCEYDLRRVQSVTSTHYVKACDYNMEAPTSNEALHDATKTHEEVTLPLAYVATLDEMSNISPSLEPSPVSMNGNLDACDDSNVTKLHVHAMAYVDDGPKVSLVGKLVSLVILVIQTTSWCSSQAHIMLRLWGSV